MKIDLLLPTASKIYHVLQYPLHLHCVFDLLKGIAVRRLHIGPSDLGSSSSSGAIPERYKKGGKNALAKRLVFFFHVFVFAIEFSSDLFCRVLKENDAPDRR
jgi:hypothetical protein